MSNADVKLIGDEAIEISKYLDLVEIQYCNIKNHSTLRLQAATSHVSSNNFVPAASTTLATQIGIAKGLEHYSDGKAASIKEQQKENASQLKIHTKKFQETSAKLKQEESKLQEKQELKEELISNQGLFLARNELAKNDKTYQQMWTRAQNLAKKQDELYGQAGKMANAPIQAL